MVLWRISGIFGRFGQAWLHGASDKSTHPYPRIVFWLALARGGKGAATVLCLFCAFECFCACFALLSVFVCVCVFLI